MQVNHTNSNLALENIIEDVNYKILNIIDANHEHFKNLDGHSFKVRPGYGPDKFYLDWTDYQGTYEYTIQNLIHHILWKDGYYKKILDTVEYESVKKIIDTEPDNIYESDNKETQIKLNKVYKNVILKIASFLHDNYKDSFSEENYKHYIRMGGFNPPL